MSENKPHRSQAAASDGDADTTTPAASDSQPDGDRAVASEGRADRARAAAGQGKVEKQGWFQRLLGMEPEGLDAQLARLSADAAQARADFERAALEAEAASAALKNEQERTANLTQTLEAVRERETGLQARLRELERAGEAERERALTSLRTQLEQARAAAARSTEGEARARRELEQLRARALKLEQANAAHEQARSGELNLLHSREAQLTARDQQAAELTRACARLEAEKANWTAAQRKLLDEHDTLSAQLDEVRLELEHQREGHKAAQAQWLALSLSFWRALERVLGARAPLAISCTTPAHELGPGRSAPATMASELDQLFASIGLEVESSLQDVPVGVELRLRGSSIAPSVVPEPLWFAGVALPQLERALGRKLGVDGTTRSGHEELLLRLRERPARH